MKKILIALFALITITAQADPPLNKTIDFSGSTAPALQFYQGNYRTVIWNEVNNNKAIDGTPYAPYMLYYVSTGAIQATCSWINQTQGIAQAIFTPSQLNTNGSFIYSVGILSNNMPTTARQGTLTIIRDNYFLANPLNPFVSTIDFSTLSFLNTTNGALVAGSNINFRSVGSRGQYAIDASAQESQTTQVYTAQAGTVVGVQSQLLASALQPVSTQGLVRADITNGLASISYVDVATQGLVKADITNGLASLTYVDSATNSSDIARLSKANNFTIRPQANGTNFLLVGEASVQTNQVEISFATNSTYATHAVTATTASNSPSGAFGSAATNANTDFVSVSGGLYEADAGWSMASPNSTNYMLVSKSRVRLASGSQGITVSNNGTYMTSPVYVDLNPVLTNPAAFYTAGSTVASATSATYSASVTGPQSNTIASALQPVGNGGSLANTISIFTNHTLIASARSLDFLAGFVVSNHVGFPQQYDVSYVDDDSAYLTNGSTASLNGTGITNMPINSGFQNVYEGTMVFSNLNRTWYYSTNNTVVRYTTKNQHWWTATNMQSQIPDTEGLWYFYFDANSGQLTTSQTEWTIAGGEAQIAMVYWDKQNTNCTYMGDERHGKDITDTEHVEHHFIEGAKWFSGGAIIHNALGGTTAPSTSGSNTVVAILPSSLWDDDHTNNTPGLGNQSAVTYTNSGAQFLCSYATGLVASAAWRTNSGGYFPFMLTPEGSRPVYNSLTAGVWGTNQVPEDNYFISWIVQIPSYQDGSAIGSGFRIIPDSVVSTTLTGSQARTYANILENRTYGISEEMKPLYRLIFLKNETAPNAHSVLVKYTKLVEVQDIRQSLGNPAVALTGAQVDYSVFMRRDGTISWTGDENGNQLSSTNWANVQATTGTFANITLGTNAVSLLPIANAAVSNSVLMAISSSNFTWTSNLTLGAVSASSLTGTSVNATNVTVNGGVTQTGVAVTNYFAGKIGIGVTTPTNQLVIQLNNGNNARSATIEFQRAISTYGATIYEKNTNAEENICFGIATGGDTTTERLRLPSYGGIVIIPVSVSPAATSGGIYYDSDVNIFYSCTNNSTWTPL